MIRVSLIGPGDINFHFGQVLKIKKRFLESQLQGIAQALADSGVEIELTPNKGVAFELAKKYKKFKGKKIIGTLPKSDKRYGINHLKPYLNNKLFDEFIDTKDWRDQNRLKGLFGDVVLYLGTTPGTSLESNYSIYLFKLMQRMKQGLKAKGLHPKIKAKQGTYTHLIYTPFLKSKKIPAETEAYMKKFGINLVYIKNPKELRKYLSMISPKSQH